MMSDVLVQIDWPDHRELSRTVRLPAAPREGEAFQVGDVSGVVRSVVWFVNDGVIVRVVVGSPRPPVSSSQEGEET